MGTIKQVTHIRLSKTVLDSGFHTKDSGLQALNSSFFVSGTWMLDFIWGILDSVSMIMDSKPQDSNSTVKSFLDSKKFHRSSIWIPLHAVKQD